MVTDHVRSGIAATTENVANLREGLAQPGILEEATITRVKRVYANQAADVEELFAGQLEHWRAQHPTGATASHVEDYARLVDELRAITAAAIEIGEQLVSMESLMSAPNEAWGLAALLEQRDPTELPEQ
jgi:hypothetical protein